jgi:hypothetical protein
MFAATASCQSRLNLVTVATGHVRAELADDELFALVA